MEIPHKDIPMAAIFKTFLNYMENTLLDGVNHKDFAPEDALKIADALCRGFMRSIITALSPNPCSGCADESTCDKTTPAIPVTKYDTDLADEMLPSSLRGKRSPTKLEVN